MAFISPYSVMLTTNLEPVYGIVLAFFVFGSSEQMTPMFYAGASVILLTVIANGILKNRLKLKTKTKA
jgi:drug/metabolite transporter (DMT)-like permease